MKKLCLLLIICFSFLITLPFTASLQTPERLMIYEVYTSGGYNSGKNAAPYKNCYIVLYNSGNSAVNLDNWSVKFAEGLSDKVLLSIALSGTIQSGGFYVIEGGSCADAENPPAGSSLPFAANFTDPNLKLTRKYGKIALCTPSGNDASVITSKSEFAADFLGYGIKDTEVNDYEAEPADEISVKRIYRRYATADADNNKTDFNLIDIVDNPDKVINYDASTFVMPIYRVAFSSPAGYYKDAFTLKLTTNIGGTNPEIYYTADGSDPLDENGNATAFAIKYSDIEGIDIFDRTGQPSNMMNIEGTTVPDESEEFQWPPVKLKDESDEAYQKRLKDLFDGVFKINSIKAQAKNSEGQISQLAYGSYFVSPTNFEERFGLPVFSITTDRRNLYDPEIGIWMNDNQYIWGEEVERPAEIQFFEKNGKIAFEDKIGIRLNGNHSRLFPQKAIRVYMRNKTLNYDLFEGKALDNSGKSITKFKNYILRASANDWPSSAIRDAFWGRYVSGGKGYETIGYRPCVGFINGEFFGIYDIRERVDSNMFANHYGIPSDDVVVCEHFKDLKDGLPGDENHLRDLVAFINKNDMTLPENYKVFTDGFEEDGFIDYYVHMIYAGYGAFPDRNVKMWHNKNPENGFDTKWRMVINDLDTAFASSHAGDDTLDVAKGSSSTSGGELLKKLLENPTFRKKFATRYFYLSATNYKPDNMKKVFTQLRNEVDKATPEHRIRWNLSMDKLERNVRDRFKFFDQRASNMIEFGKNGLDVVYFSYDSAGGKVFADGVEIIDGAANCIIPGMNTRLNAVPNSGYVFAGFEFTGMHGGVATTDRNNAGFVINSSGFCKPLFVKKGEKMPDVNKNELSAATFEKVKDSLILSIGFSDGIFKGGLLPVDNNDSSVKPIIAEDRTLVPARFITETLGGTVSWNGETNEGVCTVGKNEVRFTLDSDVMYVNGKKVILDAPARTLGGRTLLPLRAFCESLGYTVYWNSEKELIVISSLPLTFDQNGVNELSGFIKGEVKILK